MLPRFYTLDLDDKMRLVGVVAAFMGRSSEDYLLRVFDARTNKSIGRFTQLIGLVLE